MPTKAGIGGKKGGILLIQPLQLTKLIEADFGCHHLPTIPIVHLVAQKLIIRQEAHGIVAEYPVHKG